jgi:DUF4097 and DUF4098 domain-containing protein YvlB
MNKYMEEYISVYNLHYNQDRIKKNNETIFEGQQVSVYNPSAMFNKLSPKTLHGDWSITKINQSNGKVTVKNESGDEMEISRYFVQ